MPYTLIQWHGDFGKPEHNVNDAYKLVLVFTQPLYTTSTMTVFQPRRDNVSTWTIPDELGTFETNCRPQLAFMVKANTPAMGKRRAAVKCGEPKKAEAGQSEFLFRRLIDAIEDVWEATTHQMGNDPRAYATDAAPTTEKNFAISRAP